MFQKNNDKRNNKVKKCPILSDWALVELYDSKRGLEPTL
jgi:hypothetical protein